MNAPAFDAWLDAFFASYFRRRPVSATFIGRHEFDDRLPDFSAQGIADTLADADDLLARLDALPAETLGTAQRLDRDLARGFLLIQQWESASRHFGPANPTVLTGEAVFGVVSLLLRPFAPLAERLDLATARLAAIPTFLDVGRSAMAPVPAAWLARARRECTGARLLLQDGLANFEHRALRGAAAAAVDAFVRFDNSLEQALPQATTTCAAGGEALDLVLQHAHFLDGSADDLERQALDRIAAEEEAIAALPPAPAVPPAPGAAPPSPPIGGDYLERFEALWVAARALARTNDLLTFPDWPVRYVERPLWARDAAPYLYFLPYRSPAPFDHQPEVEYLVPPGADDSTIKLNHVVHHGSLGHHVQNWFAARAESRVGRIAAVDCASRIAMLCGGTMAEGWANYATDLAEEHGFLTSAERAGQHAARIRMAARAVVDIRLHQGRFTLDEAISFYRHRVGMAPSAAEAEAVKNSLFPGAACMYLAGWDGIWRLRRRLAAGRAGDLSLQEFHDRLLSFGSVPVALIERAMLESPTAAAGAHSS
ncbi:MAG TPA: DUF885 family protein [Chloroflexota bacterium]|jgi:hypothetical protein|nr:DUF885 family protein [Chloroflexota bacterium]